MSEQNSRLLAAHDEVLRPTLSCAGVGERVRGPGRPVDHDLTDRLRAVTVDLLGRIGLDTFNAETVARAARCGKAAIYRRWQDVYHLAGDALRAHPVRMGVEDSGTLAGDVTRLLEQWQQPLTGEERAVAAVLGGAHEEPHLAAGVAAAVEEPLRRLLDTLVDRAARRGHRLPEAQVRLLTEVLGALHRRRLLTTDLNTPSMPAERRVLLVEVLVGDR